MFKYFRNKTFKKLQDSIDICWLEVKNKIDKKIKTMTNRRLTLFQRSIIINSLLTSQIWYIAQTYPLTPMWSKQINRLLFNYIWLRKSEPIRRDTLTLDKQMGGLSLINIHIKAQCIFACRLIKQFLLDEDQSSLLSYYIAIRLNPLFNIQSLPHNICTAKNPYLGQGVEFIRKFIHLRDFPNITSKAAYAHVIENKQPRIQEMYPLNNWKNIWTNLNFRYIPIRIREVLFKYIHEILPNKYRLKQIRISTSEMCDVCNVAETNLHMVYQCREINQVKDFFIRLLQYCGFMNVNMMQIILLDIPKMEKKCKNTVVLLTALYISCIWYGRTNKSSIINVLKLGIVKERNTLELMLKDRISDTFTERFISLNKENIDAV